MKNGANAIRPGTDGRTDQAVQGAVRADQRDLCGKARRQQQIHSRYRMRLKGHIVKEAVHSGSGIGRIGRLPAPGRYSQAAPRM